MPSAHGYGIGRCMGSGLLPEPHFGLGVQLTTVWPRLFSRFACWRWTCASLSRCEAVRMHSRFRASPAHDARLPSVSGKTRRPAAAGLLPSLRSIRAVRGGSATTVVAAAVVVIAAAAVAAPAVPAAAAAAQQEDQDDDPPAAPTETTIVTTTHDLSPHIRYPGHRDRLGRRRGKLAAPEPSPVAPRPRGRLSCPFLRHTMWGPENWFPSPTRVFARTPKE